MKRVCMLAATICLVATSAPRLADGAPRKKAEEEEVAKEPAAPTITIEGPLQVEVAADMFEGESYHGWVHDHARTALDNGEPLASGERVVIKLGGMALSYTVSVGAYRPKEEGKPHWTTDITCECSHDELLEKIEELVGQASDELAVQREAERAAQAERERLARERADAAEQQKKKQLEDENKLRNRPYRPERLGFAGAIATGVGGGMLVTGIALAAKGEGAPTNNDLVAPSNLRPPGFALLGVGLGVLTAGVSMLVVDYARCRKDRLECGKRSGIFNRAARARGRNMAWR